jgi:hypothetical protein
LLLLLTARLFTAALDLRHAEIVTEHAQVATVDPEAASAGYSGSRAVAFACQEERGDRPPGLLRPADD